MPTSCAGSACSSPMHMPSSLMPGREDVIPTTLPPPMTWLGAGAMGLWSRAYPGGYHVRLGYAAGVAGLAGMDGIKGVWVVMVPGPVR